MRRATSRRGTSINSSGGAVSLVEAQPYQGKKKGADTGINGVKFFRDLDRKEVRKITKATQRSRGSSELGSSGMGSAFPH